MPRGQSACLPFPPELQGLRCGAKTRAGTPCKRRDLYASGRCRLHGGLSTGPKRKRTP
ncbi:HGGxSTG domain-containing protein [Pseudomonas extremaustralis]|uniref:HGGxSTG domain-containing protein n=1 Tax=Pseudomonas extremaustralis TaxID=359110 RepID=UPI003862100A